MQYYYVSNKYISYLKQFDSKVPENKNQTRPYIGIVFQLNNLKYYAPLSSPKPKFVTMKEGRDLVKIKQGELGVINLNNMIPVPEEGLIPFSVSGVVDYKYKRLLISQLREINKMSDKILDKAEKLRHMCLRDNDTLSQFELNIKKRCCEFSLLEEKMIDYIS